MPGRQPDLLRELAPGPKLAIAAEALFLANLMIAPGVAFVLLVLLWAIMRRRADALTLNHLEQTVVASLWGGAALFGVSLAIFLLGGLDNPWSWVVGVLYFLCFHASLILGGVVGLNRAILARPWRFPVIGPRIRY
ncbi:hypothetical protein C0099_09310 [Pseudazoarcus pumilus]|uniref:DUF4870 domain-containing protein n=2 Tax=Pseudazoarcus pumilus TaxID=2067960 RepID=A0A2I6SAX8_9RHOO|nr:hypothetical protein [Pseudazoarcus pumilus]AUN96416.1 hypothetical protein C0099_09310 [Pseudazoarcus pumilus]